MCSQLFEVENRGIVKMYAKILKNRLINQYFICQRSLTVNC